MFFCVNIAGGFIIDGEHYQEGKVHRFIIPRSWAGKALRNRWIIKTDQFGKPLTPAPPPGQLPGSIDAPEDWTPLPAGDDIDALNEEMLRRMFGA